MGLIAGCIVARCCVEMLRHLASQRQAFTRSRYKARENLHARATIGFGFTSDWLKKWRENFEPITE